MIRLLVLCCRIIFVYSLVISIHNCAHFSSILLLLHLKLALSCLSLPGRCLTPFVSCGAYRTMYFGEPQAVLPVKVCRVQQDEDEECLGCLAARCLCWCVLDGFSSTDACTACSSNMSLFLSFALLISWLHWLSCRPPASCWCQKVFMLRF